ncbi:hypothetical protein EJB05_22222, partial [Eragrostis curvula]
MDPAASAPRLRMVRRRSFAGDGGVHVEGELELVLGRRRRVQELEEAVARLQAEKEAAESGAASLRAELELEQFASETATSEMMLMIGRLQREKAAAMIEAREFRRIAGGVCELQDQFAAVCALAASYQALLRAHGIDPESEHQEESVVVNKSPPPAAEDLFEDKYAVDVRCAAVPEGSVADAPGALCARVEALEADSAAVRREVEALRLTRDGAAEKQQRFSPFSGLGIFKWFFSPISWGMKSSVSAARKLPSIFASPTTYFLLALLPLLERSKGTLQIQSKTRCQPVHSQEPQNFTLCYFFQ